jgi:hypothetical protein
VIARPDPGAPFNFFDLTKTKFRIFNTDKIQKGNTQWFFIVEEVVKEINERVR